MVDSVKQPTCNQQCVRAPQRRMQAATGRSNKELTRGWWRVRAQLAL